MNLPLPSSLPAVILSSPRTGSKLVMNAFHEILLEHNINIQMFDEPDYSKYRNVNNERMSLFTEYAMTSNDYLLKCHYFRLELYDKNVVNNFLTYGYKIRIRRRNVVKQIASQYIAVKRNKTYHYFDKDDCNTGPIEIVESEIDSRSEVILDANSVLDNAPIDFDLDLWYEDLEIPENFSSQIVTPKPSNYLELCDIIQKRLSA